MNPFEHKDYLNKSGESCFHDNRFDNKESIRSIKRDFEVLAVRFQCLTRNYSMAKEINKEEAKYGYLLY